MLIPDVDLFEERFPGGHGGARENSGPKKGYIKSPDAIAFESARARNEAAKAALNEHELKVKSGEYVARDVVRSVSATTSSTIAQALRSIPDNLERKGIDPQVCADIAEVIDEALNDLAEQFKLMTEDQVAAPDES